MRFLLLASLFIIFTNAVRADTIVLRSGERIEGKIKLETANRIIITPLTGGSRTVERAEVANVVRAAVTTPAADPLPVEAPAVAVAATAPAVPAWPPVKGQPYPDLTLFNHEGKLVSLSSFRGKIIIIEPVGMTCPACNAFVGGNKVGGFEGVQPQTDCATLDEYFTVSSAGTTLSDPRVVWVQLILYNMQMQAPSVDDLRRWRAHFPALRRPNCVILAGTPGMIGNASYAMIPGVQLIDRHFVLRSDFRGHGGGDDINRHLLPLMKDLINHPGQ